MEKKLTERIGYCGLICELDSCYGNCGGCKTPGANCGDKDCFHKKCCIEKSLNGCWECEQAPCDYGYFSKSDSSSGQFTGCIRHIKLVGLTAYVDKIKANTLKGIKYGMRGDYGNRSEEEVLKLLEEGK